MTKPSLALGNLRAVTIVIVLTFHSSLAYLASTPVATTPFDQPPYNWQAFPIVDSHRWLGFDIFCASQDVTLMSLMFFLSGLFVPGSLQRKGSRTYVTDRLWRIGLPFLAAIIFLSPLSFYPAYVVRTVNPSLDGFWTQWFTLPSWPIGPQWFLWQLLVLNLAGAGLYALWPGFVNRMSRLAAWAGEAPAKFVILLIAASALGYVPLTLAFSPWTWDAIGPFSIQLCRPAHYVVVFFAGFALGSYGLDRGLLAADGPLARKWWLLLVLALLSFGAWAGFTSLTFPDWNKASGGAQVAAALTFPAACVLGSLTWLGVFLRFTAQKRTWIFDSLSANAYSIYLVHYVFVVWLQYSLLDSELIAFAKMAIVLAGALTLSWSVSAAFDRVAAGSTVVAVKRAISPIPR